MDSTEVNKAIRKSIKPYLVSCGFTASSQRTFWRYHNQDIHVLNFQSFNSYLAEGLGVSTFSFSVNLGLFCRNIGLGYTIKEKDGKLLPDEAQCHFRGRIMASDEHRTPRKDIWAISTDGSNMDLCISDALSQISRVLESWFKQIEAIEDKIRLVEIQPQRMPDLWGWGNNPSPNRSLFLAALYFEIDLGKCKKYLEEVVDGPSHKNLFKTIDEGLEYIKQKHLVSR